MKKIIGILMVAFAFTACSSDDDSNGNKLEGTWKMTSFKTESAFDFNGDGKASNDVMVETDCYKNELLRFNADNTGKAISSSSVEISLELVSGTTDEYEYATECMPEVSSRDFTYEQNGNNITLSYDGFASMGTISNNKLTVVIPSGFTVEVEDLTSGTMIVQEDVTLVYTRQ